MCILKILEDDSDSDEQILGNNSETNNNMFLVTLRTSHFESKSHGVYLRKICNNFYKEWKKGKHLTLCYKGKYWKVKGNVSSKRCRLAKGWSYFTGDTAFVIGQQIKFQYLGGENKLFVTVDTPEFLIRFVLFHRKIGY